MQSFTGIVVSNKTAQTVGVQLSYFQKHPKYLKIIKLTTKVLAHNELVGVNEGDTVKIVKSRPFSKLKHFQVVEILEHKKMDLTEQPKKEVKEKVAVEQKPVEKVKAEPKKVKKETKTKSK